MEPKENDGTVQSDRTLFSIIEGIKELDGAGITDLSDHLDMPMSTVHKHVKTLHQKEYLIKNGDTYELGLRFFTLGGFIRDMNKLYQVSKPFIINLSEITGETTLLTIKDHNRGILVWYTNDKHNLYRSIPSGSRFYLHASAAGKAILAQLPNDEVKDIINSVGLPKKTENTITQQDVLLEELDQVRENRYAINQEEHDKGISGISVGVKHSEEEIYGSISITGPANRLTEERLQNEFAEELLGMVNEIEIQMNLGNIV